MSARPPWTWGSLPEARSFKEIGSYLNDRFSDLEDWVAQIHREVTFGPVSGAVVNVTLGRSAALLPTGVVDLYSFAYEMRPVQFSAVCFGGGLTFDLLSQSSSILSAGPISLAAATPQALNQASDFAVDRITSDLSLSISSIDSGAPAHLRLGFLGIDVSLVPQ